MHASWLRLPTPSPTASTYLFRRACCTLTARNINGNIYSNEKNDMRRRMSRFVPTAHIIPRRSLGTVARTQGQRRVVDLRSDTVTAPSRAMLETCLNAKVGDDVMGEDPTVEELETFVAQELFQKQTRGLFVPTGTMSNLVAILAHCHGRASEIVVGSNSHICLYEGGNAANLGGVHSRQIPEHPETAELAPQDIRDVVRSDDDDHYAHTKLLCLENTHNLMGGVALPKQYIDSMAALCHGELGIALHIDGARILNAAVALNLPVHELCQSADSISVCLSKGLGAPLGSVLVSDDAEFIRLAKRARKRCGGGMRQVGVVAAFGLYAVQNNAERLALDHQRAQRLADQLQQHGFSLARNNKVDTNIVYFGLPEESRVNIQNFCDRLWNEYGVKLGGGYSRGGALFRAVTHLDVTDEDIEYAADAMIQLCLTAGSNK